MVVRVCLLVLCAWSACAQGLLEGFTAERLMRQDIKAKKREILTTAMHLSEEESRRFWAIHRDYENETARLNDSAFALLDRYTKNQEQLSDADAASITRESLKLDWSRVAIREKYYQMMAKALSPKAAAWFIQLETLCHHISAVQLAMNVSLVE